MKRKRPLTCDLHSNSPTTLANQIQDLPKLNAIKKQQTNQPPQSRLPSHPTLEFESLKLKDANYKGGQVCLIASYFSKLSIYNPVLHYLFNQYTVKALTMKVQTRLKSRTQPSLLKHNTLMLNHQNARTNRPLWRPNQTTSNLLTNLQLLLYLASTPSKLIKN